MPDAATHAPAQLKRGDITHYRTLSQGTRTAPPLGLVRRHQLTPHSL